MKKILIIFSLLVMSLMVVGVSADTISFLYEDGFAGVDGDTSSWSDDNGMVNLGETHWSLLDGKAEVLGYLNSQNDGILTHRGTRGLGIYGGEPDEIDSIEEGENLRIVFDEPYYINSIETRSLFVPEGEGDPEEGDITFKLLGSEIEDDHMVASENSGNGVWSETYEDLLVDEIIFYINETEDYADWSEFAVTKLEVESQCKIIIDEPQESHWYDPVDIEWHYEGNCDILNQELYYYEGSCEAGSNLIAVLNSEPREYPWDVFALEDGDYCVSIYVEQHNPPALDVEGFSGIFHLDLTPPESEISFGNPNVGCDGEGDCYINKNTPITITCEDGEGSGVDTIYYNIFVEDGYGGWELAHSFSEEDDEVEFNCHEDSRHKIEYWCVDKVGKVEEPNEEIIYVDTVAPIITKEIVGPKVGDCPPEEEGDECWIADHRTQIVVEAIDPEPHPVDDVYCEWGYWFEDYFYGLWYPYVEPIIFYEDCIHELHIRCWDALGNEAYDVETFYVDSSAPYTWKWYEGPFYEFEGIKYINGVTTVNLDAYDLPEESICAVGVDETYYRYEIVDEFYCEGEGQWESTSKEDCSWNLYEEPFTMEESCHVIEYYSIDLLGNEESVQWQFVFVDKTAPEPIKEVGKPSHDCNGLWEILVGECEDNWDWIVTMETPITLSCEEQGPHPSGIKEICYRITLDGTLMEDWACVEVDENDEIEVIFNEESEHLLEFYCIDNVDKTSEIDSELFKVEGTAFEIELSEKWNLISIPFPLISNNIEEVFEDISEDIEAVWSYDETGWHVYAPEGPSDLDEINPGYGYWVKAKEETTLIVGGSLLGPAQSIPPSRQLQSGWNLIGRYGLVNQEAYCALFSLIDTTIGYPRWSSLYGYDADSDEFTILDTESNTNPGEGYWIEMDIADTYSPATVCWGV